jgi:hypothetical protein
VTIDDGGQPLREGDVIYFHDLHLDSARRVSERPTCRNTYFYQVEGKPRPMIILDDIEENRDGVRWFRVVKLSTNISEWKRKRGYVWIGPIVDQGTQSYADRTPCWIPENLVAGVVKKRLNRMELTSICSIIGFKLGPPLE